MLWLYLKFKNINFLINIILKYNYRLKYLELINFEFFFVKVSVLLLGVTYIKYFTVHIIPWDRIYHFPILKW